MQTVVAMRDTKAADPTRVAAPTAAAGAPAPGVAPAATSAKTARSAFVPLLLGLLAVTAWLGHHAWLVEQDRQQLQAARANLQPTVEKSAGLRQSLDRLAADTQRRADAGNGNARVLVDELRKRGITINATGGATAAPTAATASTVPATAVSR